MKQNNKKKNTFVAENACGSHFFCKTSLTFAPRTRRGARVVEEARLESVYTPKGYPGFESPSLRSVMK